MSSLNKDLVFLILQFLDEENYKETVHKLEKESGVFFNMRYFEDIVTEGKWKEVEDYLKGFTKFDQNRYSMRTFFEIRKIKYLEALDKHDDAKAVEILREDLKAFSSFNENLYRQLTELVTLSDFREIELLSPYTDAKTARANLLYEIKKLIEANPLIRDKLQFPTLTNSRLRTLINQSLNWQHQLCKNPKPNPDIETLFVDHSCEQANDARAPSPVPNPLMDSIPGFGVYSSIGGHVPFQHAPASTTSLAGWMPNPSSVPHQAISMGPMGLTPPNNAADSEHLLKRSGTFGVPEEVNNKNLPPLMFSSQRHAHSMHTGNDLPKNVVANLNQGSAVKSIDFHPGQQTLLLVGTSIGDISIWEVCKGEKILVRGFEVWDLEACSMTLQVSLASEYTASVNRVLWSSDGSVFGVAYSKHIVQLYAYYGGDDLRNRLEMDAHVGSVNDLAFSHPNKQFCVITCGDDKMIKVWDAATGARLYTFEGHEAPVYSICPHQRENIQCIISTATDGKIKTWVYDNMDSRVNYDGQGCSRTTMAYSTDGTRLFSCGTSKNGESSMVEWGESWGFIKRAYAGLGKHTVGVVQFDTTKNRYLAAGDEFKIKFWDMDNENILAISNADGGLPESPCIRFCKKGELLAVSTIQNGIKILANAERMRLTRPMANRAETTSKAPVIGTFVASTSATGPSMHEDRSSPVAPAIALDGDGSKLPDAESRISNEFDKSKMWEPTEINEPVQLRNLRLPDSLLPVRGIIQLIYTNSGSSILALAYNAVHKLWKWQQSERNASGKASTSVPPKLWQPSSGISMINDISETNVEKSVPCFALSKNDSYVLSASGGKISLFSMRTFKTMTTLMPPPPAATFLAFHPQDNNIIAIGMEDSSIQIYNVQQNEVIAMLNGHKKQVTGLAFSSILGVLVSSSADGQLCVWTLEGWENRTSKLLPIPTAATGSELNNNRQTRLQFHQDQMHVLVVHKTRIAIYEASGLDFINQWIAMELSHKITDATYSCDSQSIFTCFTDGSVYIFTAQGLKLRCRISPAAYLPSQPSFQNYPLVIASHPSEANQFALGLADGGVHVLEPLEYEGKWGTAPEQEQGAGTSKSSAGDQSSR